MKRLFVAVNLPESAKSVLDEPLFRYRKHLPNVRMIPPENWHITVLFLGNQDERNITAIEKAIERVAARHEPIPIEVRSLTYGPPGPTPRMIWANGKSDRLASFKEDLERELGDAGIPFQDEFRSFKIHITLAKFREPTPLRDLPQIPSPVHAPVHARSVELMESKLTPSGAIYEVARSYPFGK